MDQLLSNAIQSIPPGRWAIGVSGGADSLALLTLLRQRADLSLHVVHLNHETRGVESEGDERFVADLAMRLGVPCTIARRGQLERGLTDLPSNPSARYRRLRLALFRRVAQENRLQGVLLAHHADDQAETILHRLLRGSSSAGLAGMGALGVIGEVHCLRPLLKIRRVLLRDWLTECGEPWREDESNTSPKYLRNRLRTFLATEPALNEALLELGQASARLRDWVAIAAPPAQAKLSVRTMRDLPIILARATARNWLVSSGVSPAKIEPEIIDRLLGMCLDASTAARVDFPCGVRAARHRGVIENLRIV